MSLVYEEKTKQYIRKIADNLPHALLLTGPHGVGLNTIARDIGWRNIAEEIKPTDSNNREDYSDKGIIRIDQIRRLELLTRGKSTKRMVYIIDDADKMSLGAQQSFLKLLEEPSSNTHFILTTHKLEKILSTIKSRAQILSIRAIKTQDSYKFIQKIGVTDSQKVQQLMFLASGRPAELYRLSNNQKHLEKYTDVIHDARAFLESSPYDRGIIAYKYSNDRTDALLLLSMCIKLMKFSLKKNFDKKTCQQLDNISDAYDKITQNGNVRIQLLSIVV